MYLNICSPTADTLLGKFVDPLGGGVLPEEVRHRGGPSSFCSQALLPVSSSSGLDTDYNQPSAPAATPSSL